jgi:hypothetical protein
LLILQPTTTCSPCILSLSKDPRVERKIAAHSWLDSSSGSELTTNGNGALLENNRNDYLCHHNRKLLKQVVEKANEGRLFKNAQMLGVRNHEK